MMTMTMRVKFADASTDEGYTDIFCKSLNLKARGSVLEDRTRQHEHAGDPEWRALELWAQDLRAEGLSATELPVAASVSAGRTSQRLVEQDALAEMLEEMSLSTLLYYVLAGEGMNTDESS
jgi:hypothetical protein